jgi:VIT1/CCC1 family predicted Fe2+/Mn2+ transporter
MGLGELGFSDYLGKFWSGAEAMYGVIIVLSFTSTLRSARVDVQQIYSTIVSAALFCCVVWGLADGFFYAWEEGYSARNQRKMIKDSKSSEKKLIAYSMVKQELGDRILGTINETERDRLYDNFVEYLSQTDVKSKGDNPFFKRPFFSSLPRYLLTTSLLSIGAGLIVLLPFFLLRNDIPVALNISNVLGMVTLFAIGFLRTKDERFSRKIVFGVVSALLGLVIAVIILIFGG